MADSKISALTEQTTLEATNEFVLADSGATKKITGSALAAGVAAATKLDDLATPDDNTDLDASSSLHGLLPKLSGSGAQFLNGAGSWAAVTGAPAPTYKTGLYYVTSPTSLTDGTQLMVLDRMDMQPFPVYRDVTIDRISIGVSQAGGSGNVIRLGIYADSAGGPGTLILDAGTVAGDSAGYKEVTVSQSLAAGALYWMAIVPQVAGSPAPLVRTSGLGGASWVGGVQAADPRTQIYSQSGVTGALPSTATPATGGTGAQFAIKVRIA